MIIAGLIEALSELNDLSTPRFSTYPVIDTYLVSSKLVLLFGQRFVFNVL